MKESNGTKLGGVVTNRLPAVVTNLQRNTSSNTVNEIVVVSRFVCRRFMRVYIYIYRYAYIYICICIYVYIYIYMYMYIYIYIYVYIYI